MIYTAVENDCPLVSFDLALPGVFAWFVGGLYLALTLPFRIFKQMVNNCRSVNGLRDKVKILMEYFLYLPFLAFAIIWDTVGFLHAYNIFDYENIMDELGYCRECIEFYPLDFGL